MKNDTKLIIRGLLLTSSIAVLVYLRGVYLLSRKSSSSSSSAAASSSQPSPLNSDKDTNAILDASQSQSQLLVVTRVHRKASSSMPDPMKVLSFINSAMYYSSHILICIGSDKYDDILSYIETIKVLVARADFIDGSIARMDHIHFLPVVPWGHFTTALNVALLYAQDKQFKYIAFQSVELKISSYEVELMLGRLKKHEEKTIVIGPELEGHEFSEGYHMKGLRGRTCPWNTFAIWNIDILALIGFPMIADGTMMDRSIGGVEEVATISILQQLKSHYQAILVRIQYKAFIHNIDRKISNDKDNHNSNDKKEHLQWNTTFDDTSRISYHQNKMKSKDTRPNKQLRLLGLHETPGNVIHEILS